MRLTVIVLAIVAATGAAAQQSLDLAAAQQLAAGADPRVAQLQLEAQQSELRLKNIEMEKRPVLSVLGQAQYQSEVVQLPIPGRAPTVSKDTYDASVAFDQTLLDPTRRARIEAERARAVEAQARVNTALFGLRQEVNEAYFAAALLQEREAQIANSITDLEARLREARIRVENGTALPSEAASIEATLLQRGEDVRELQANRRAALDRLAKLTGRELAASDKLAIPVLDAKFEEARSRAAAVRERPEFAQIGAAQRRLEMQKDLSRTDQKPHLSAYGRAGYGMPGLNFLRNDFHAYGLAGVRLQWKPWDWGKSERDQRIAELQQQSLQADADALARTIDRAVQNDLASADRLRDTVATDDRIVALRELIEKETRVRFDERVVTAADYIDKETDVLDARLLRATHRVELAQAQARALNTLGVEIH